MPPAKILLADDDAGVLEGLARLCRALGHEVLSTSSGPAAVELARDAAPDLVLIDVHMPGGGGLEALPALVALERAPSVVVMTGLADVPTAVEAMRGGAADFLEKPVRRAVLELVLERVLRGRAVVAERDRLREEVSLARCGPVIVRSAPMRRVMDQVRRVARAASTTALVTGESGVGKELVARAIHEHSARRAAPFVAVNCAALTESLLEAELFGYEPGAFTGARPGGAEGLLAAAEGGTLLFDEVAELAPPLQAKLLRVLQERVYRRVGGGRDVRMDLRVVASTNRDLEERVAAGAFREDLFYRLNVLSLRVAPLRERREDVPPLAASFLARFGADFGRELTGFTPAAAELLGRHPWPGNVRELRNAIERAALLADDPLVGPEHLALGAAPRSGPGPGPAADPAPPPEPAPRSGDRSLRAVEEVWIRRVLAECGGNRSEAARVLGVNRTTLYNKLRRYGLAEPRPADAGRPERAAS